MDSCNGKGEGCLIGREEQFCYGSDYKDLQIKPGYKSLKLWVAPNGHIFLSSSSLKKNARDFLNAFGEQVSLNKYKLTPCSLYAAACNGVETESIIDSLKHYSKTILLDGIEELITESTLPFGKVILVSNGSNYFVESHCPDVTKKLFGLIKKCRLCNCVESSADRLTTQHHDHQAPCIQFGKPIGTPEENSGEDGEKMLEKDEDHEDEYLPPTFAFEVKDENIEDFQDGCFEMGYRLLPEYDFRNDTYNLDVKIKLKTCAVDIIRPYQKESLQIIFERNRARSGLIILPCGAGKSLVGVAACCTIQKRALILCKSEFAVEYWKAQFKMWSTADNDMICRFTWNANDNPGCSKVLITTYDMITHRHRDPSPELKRKITWLRQQEWGIMVLDGVHEFPTNMLDSAHCKISLINPLVPKDEITDHNLLIGPKLYEANMLELQEGGWLAQVICAEIQCPINPDFLREYVDCKSTKKKLLCWMDPNKFRACQFLIRYHEQRNERIIVFSDNSYPLKHYALTMKKPLVLSSTPLIKRKEIFEPFKNGESPTIFVAEGMADNFLYLPRADVLIKITSNGGSPCQEARRLGHILQAKEGPISNYSAFFYILVLQHTNEVKFSTDLQKFLVNQGYYFNANMKLEGMDKDQELNYSNKEEQSNLREMVLDEIVEMDEEIKQLTEFT